MHTKMPLMFPSPNFEARPFLISPKSSMSQSDRDNTIPLAVLDGCRSKLLPSYNEGEAVAATANKALDGLDKIAATFANMVSGISFRSRLP